MSSSRPTPLLARPARSFDDDDLGCLLHKRYRIAHGATASRVSFQPMMTRSTRSIYAVRHHQRRTSQLQNRLAGIESSIRTATSPFAPDHHRICISRLTD